jgi:hypothetical protein
MTGPRLKDGQVTSHAPPQSLNQFSLWDWAVKAAIDDDQYRGDRRDRVRYD